MCYNILIRNSRGSFVMGIFKKILGGLGLKQQDEINSQQVYENSLPAEKEKTLPTEEEKTVSVSNLNCYAPKTNTEVKMIIDSLKKHEPCIINLGGLTESDIRSILDYLGGALYALDGMISRLQGDIYILSPSGIKITSSTN